MKNTRHKTADARHLPEVPACRPGRDLKQFFSPSALWEEPPALGGKVISDEPTQAFTLIELLISSVLIAVVALAIYTALSSGISLWARTNSAGIQKERVIILLERLAREWRNSIKFSGIDFEGTQDTLSFPALITQIYSEAETSQPFIIHLPGRITYRFDEDDETILYQRLTYKELNSDIESEDISEESMGTRIEISNIKSLLFSYYKYDEEEEEWVWDEAWPDAPTRPIAIKIEIALKGEKYVPEETITRTIYLFH